MASTQGGKGNRKKDRNKRVCEKYTMSGKHWTNKIKRIEREINKVSNKLDKMRAKNMTGENGIEKHIWTLRDQLKSVTARMANEFKKHT